MSYVTQWLLAFALTVAIEVPLVVALTQGVHLSWSKRAGFAFFAQLMTHPLVWFVFPRIPGMTRYTTLAISEIWAWLAEAAFYALAGIAPSKLRAVSVAALANAASLAIGWLFF